MVGSPPSLWAGPRLWGPRALNRTAAPAPALELASPPLLLCPRGTAQNTVPNSCLGDRAGPTRLEPHPQEAQLPLHTERQGVPCHQVCRAAVVRNLSHDLSARVHRSLSPHALQVNMANPLLTMLRETGRTRNWPNSADRNRRCIGQVRATLAEFDLELAEVAKHWPISRHDPPNQPISDQSDRWARFAPTTGSKFIPRGPSRSA